MAESEEDDQFSRIRLLLGTEKFLRLQKARITVAGLGAVGGYVAEALVRAGVMNIRIIDHDVFSKSNLNRQIFALNSTVGKLKVDAAYDRLKDINPACNIEKLKLFINGETVSKVFEGKPDLIVDAIDSLNPKFEILKMAHDSGAPLISSMGAALRTDPAHIKVGLLKDTRNCPLARMIRKRFAKFKIQPEIPCVYSDEELDKKNMALITPKENNQLAKGRLRNIMGSLPTITGIFGLTIANFAIKELTSVR